MIGVILTGGCIKQEDQKESPKEQVITQPTGITQPGETQKESPKEQVITQPGEAQITSHSSFIHYGSYKEWHSGKIYKGRFIHIVGEIENIGQVALKSPLLSSRGIKVSTTYYDQEGVEIEKGTHFTSIPVMKHLAPGARSPFEIILLDEEASSDVSRYEITLKYSPLEEHYPEPDLVKHNTHLSQPMTKFLVLGELQNNAEENIAVARVLATFYNEIGQVIAVGDTKGVIPILATGEKTPFKIEAHAPKEVFNAIKDYQVCTEGWVTEKTLYRKFELLSSSAKIDPGGTYQLKGKVRNTGTKDAHPDVHATFYDKEGNILTYKKSFASVKAGEEAEFHVMLTSTKYKDIIPEITSYDIKFEC